MRCLREAHPGQAQLLGQLVLQLDVHRLVVVGEP